MATIWTEPFEGTSGDPLTDWTVISGGYLEYYTDEVSATPDGTIQTGVVHYKQWGFAKNAKASVSVSFPDPGAGDYSVGLQLVLDSENWYEVRLRTNNNTPPQVSLRKTVAGSETVVMAEQAVSALSADTPVVLEIRRTGSTLQAFLDDVQVGSSQTDSDLTANWRTGIYFANSPWGVWTIDDLTLEDYTTEPSATGRVLQVGTSSYDEDGMAAASIALASMQISYLGPRVLRFREYVSHTSASFRPEQEVQLLQDGNQDFWGVLKVVKRMATGDGPEYVEYEAWGPRGQAKYVVPEHPDTGSLSITWNAAEDDDDYDADYADKMVGQILDWYLSTFVEELRQHRAAPNGDIFVTSDLNNLQVKPTKITIRGDFEAVVQSLLSFQPNYACLVDHSTRKWRFVDWTQSGTKDLSFSSLVTPANEVDDDSTQLFTAVTLRSIRREKVEVDAKTWEDSCVPDWDPALEKYWSPAVKNRSSVTCFVSDVIDSRTIELTTVYADPIFPNEWTDCTLRFIDGSAGGGEGSGANLFTIVSNTQSASKVFQVTAAADIDPAPLYGDSVELTDNPDYVTSDDLNGMKKVYRAYRVPDLEGNEELFKKNCGTAWMTRAPRAGDQTTVQERRPIQIQYAATPGVIVVAIPIVQFANGNKGAACDTQGTYQPAELEFKGEYWKTTVLERRYPTSGWHGTAYSTDEARWDGGGPPGPDDWGVQREMVIEDPHYISESQNSQIDDLLEAWLLARCNRPFRGRHAYRASATDGIDRDFVNLNTAVTFSSSKRTTGWESGSYIFAHTVTFDYGSELTVLELGNVGSFMDPEYERLRDGILDDGAKSDAERLLETLRDDWNCRKDSPVKETSEPSGPICGSQVYSSWTGGKSSSHTEKIKELESRISVLEANKDDEEELPPDPIPPPEPEGGDSEPGATVVSDVNGDLWTVDDDRNWLAVLAGADGKPSLDSKGRIQTGEPGTPARGPKSHKHAMDQKDTWDGVDTDWALPFTPRSDDPPIILWKNTGTGASGVYLQTEDYSLSGASISFVDPPASGVMTEIHCEVENYRVRRSFRVRADFLQTVRVDFAVLVDFLS